MQRNSVVGTRSSLLWLLILVVVVVFIGVIVAVLVILPQQQASRTEQARLAEVERHYQAGVAFQNANDWTAAETEYKRVILVDAGHKDVQARLAEVKGRAAAIQATATAAAMAQTAQAQANAQSTAVFAPTATAEALEMYYQRGLGYMTMGRWVEAKTVLEQVFSSNPSYKEVLSKLREVDIEIARSVPTATPTSPASPTPVASSEPTATPTPPASPTPIASTTPAALFWDDFENKSASTAKWTSVAGIWEIVDGEYFCSVGGTYKSATSLAGDVAWHDYTYTLDIMGADGVDKIVLFRYRDDKNAYAINVRSGQFNDILLGKGDAVLQSASFGNRNNTWYSLKIAVVGNVIRVYVNNELYINYLDDSSPILNGRIGVSVWTGATGNTTNYFDNVRVIPVGQ